MAVCCEYKCVKAPILQVDGEACSVCCAYGFCHCSCMSYTQRLYLDKKTNQVTFFSFTDNSKLQFKIPHTVERNTKNLKMLIDFLKLNNKLNMERLLLT